MSSERLVSGKTYEFGYANHRGSYEIRRVKFDCIQYGMVEDYYPELTMLFRGFDETRKAPRSFAINKIDMTTFKEI
jgi:hypothetical protein